MNRGSDFFFNKLAEEKRADSGGRKSLGKTPECKARGGLAAPTESEAFFRSGAPTLLECSSL